jgi:hypothetical protein
VGGFHREKATCPTCHENRLLIRAVGEHDGSKTI